VIFNLPSPSFKPDTASKAKFVYEVKISFEIAKAKTVQDDLKISSTDMNFANIFTWKNSI